MKEGASVGVREPPAVISGRPKQLSLSATVPKVIIAVVSLPSPASSAEPIPSLIAGATPKPLPAPHRPGTPGDLPRPGRCVRSHGRRRTGLRGEGVQELSEVRHPGPRLGQCPVLEPRPRFSSGVLMQGARGLPLPSASPTFPQGPWDRLGSLKFLSFIACLYWLRFGNFIAGGSWVEGFTLL